MGTSSLLGTAIILGAVVILVVYMSIKREKDYQAGMKKYNEDMAAYNAAIAALGNAPATDLYSSAASLAASAVISSADGVGSGTVTLTGVDDKTAAMIIAIVCDELKKTPAQLSFSSIRAL